MRPETVITELNEELKGVLHICTRYEAKTHMWQSSTMGHYLEFLGQELRKRRMLLNLDSRSKALILADKAAVHNCLTYLKLREQFEKENNAILIAGEDVWRTEIEIPGGWGACGAPNDGFHQHFHALRRAYMRVAVSQGGKAVSRACVVIGSLTCVGYKLAGTCT